MVQLCFCIRNSSTVNTRNNLFPSVETEVNMYSVAQHQMVHTQCLSRISPDHNMFNHTTDRSPGVLHLCSHLSVKGDVHVCLQHVIHWPRISLLQMASNSIFHRWFERSGEKTSAQAEEMCSFWHDRQ